MRSDRALVSITLLTAVAKHQLEATSKKNSGLIHDSGAIVHYHEEGMEFRTTWSIAVGALAVDRKQS